MNPDTGKFEPLTEFEEKLIRPDGTPVPKTWVVFQVDEEVVIKDTTFRVAYVGESVLLEPVKLKLVGETDALFQIQKKLTEKQRERDHAGMLKRKLSKESR